MQIKIALYRETYLEEYEGECWRKGGRERGEWRRERCEMRERGERGKEERESKRERYEARRGSRIRSQT